MENIARRMQTEGVPLLEDDQQRQLASLQLRWLFRATDRAPFCAPNACEISACLPPPPTLPVIS